jgi:DnaJ-domain-containing protein 1
MSGDLRMLGVRDGLAIAIVWVREQLARVDGPYAPSLHPKHVRKRAVRSQVLQPLKQLNKMLTDEHAKIRTAYEASLEKKQPQPVATVESRASK